MSTEIVNTDGANAPNYKTVRISSIDLPAAPPVASVQGGDGPTVPMNREFRQQTSPPEPYDNKDGKTVLIKNIKSNRPESGGSDSNLPLPPERWIHGWFVAVSGPMKGRSFPILYGNNTVGRSNTSTICLANDANISRSQFAVRYMQGKNRYIVSPINSAKQITYLPNDEELIFPSMVTEGDTLKLSPETSVRFIPFCDEQYQWDYTDLPPAPEQALPNRPAPAPVPVPVAVPVPPPQIDPALNLPPIPQFLKNEIGSTVRINTSEIGLNSGTPNVNFGNARLGSDINDGNADVAHLNATVRLERAMQNTVKQNEDDARTHIFRPNVTPGRVTSHNPAENWEQGWFVAVSGPMKGMYFPITAGINQGGRSSECRICLPADKGISSVQFAIRYVRSKKQFFVTCLETASQLTYLNGEELTGYEQIERGDILTVSEQTRLRFIPLCNDSFCWEYPDNI